MKKGHCFLRCDICGNITAVIENSGKKMVCCEQEMTPIPYSKTDEGKEKHVPQTKLEDGLLNVEVGSFPHPMTEKHYISWIAIVHGDYKQIIQLKPGGKPAAQFPINSTDAMIYAYCNEHGLWASEFKNITENKTACSPEFTEGCKK